MEVVSCPVCMNYFDRTNWMPMTLADWGHGIWLVWLQSMLARGPAYYKCPSWRVKIKNEPQQNYDLMNLIDEISVEKEVSIKIGYIPNYTTSTVLRENLLGRIAKSKDKIVSIILEDDKNSVCEEQIATITYKGDNKNDFISLLDGKIFSFSNEQMHWMLNVVSASNKLLNKEVKSILLAKWFDVVMLIPNKPAFGYNISVLVENTKIPQELNCNMNNLIFIVFFTWNKGLKSLSKSLSLIKSKSKSDTYLILHFSNQDDLLDASKILREDGLKLKNETLVLNSISDSLVKYISVS